MLIAAACLLVLALAVSIRLGAKEPPLDRDVVDRVRRSADRIRREQLLPYD